VVVDLAGRQLPGEGWAVSFDGVVQASSEVCSSSGRRQVVGDFSIMFVDADLDIIIIDLD
jgi:hypothetical protein